MARRALRSKEDIAAVPLNEPVDLDLSPDDPIMVIEDDKKTEPQKKAPQVDLREEDDPATLRKQLENMRKAEETARNQMQEAIRRENEARQIAQSLEQQNSNAQTNQLETEYDSVLNSINAAESEANLLTQSYETAAANGDYKAMAEVQRKLARTEARLESLEQGKYALESKREVRKVELSRGGPVTTQQDPFENAISQLPDSAKSWLRNHREYMTDVRKNAKIQSLHWEVLDGGAEAYSSKYFEDLETKLGLRQSSQIEDRDDEPAPTRRTPVSAPVSREVASPSTGRATPTRVTLTAEEREMARLSLPNTDPGEAERIYAQNKIKLEQLKKNGHYQER